MKKRGQSLIALSHTVNIVVTAGLIVFDDRGVCVQTLRLPFTTLFFHLPAALYLWLAGLVYGRTCRQPVIRCRQYLAGRRRRLVRLLRPELQFFAEFITGGVYWQLIY